MATLLEPPAGAAASCLVEVTIVSLQHLPKADLVGSCDTYVAIQFLDHRAQTSVCKGSYDPDFVEHFSFAVTDTHVDVGALTMHVKDWDMATSDDSIGQVVLSAELMTRVAHAEMGLTAEHTFEVLRVPTPQRKRVRQQKAVVGHDGQHCVLTLRVRVSELLDLCDPPAAAEVSGPRRLEVSVVSARHLPKMDSVGTCDAFVEIEFLEHHVQTRTRKQNLDPDFHDHFGFSLPNQCAEVGPLQLSMKDWDRTNLPEDIGTVVLTGELMQRIGLRLEKFSKASSLLNRLYTISIKLFFENTAVAMPMHAFYVVIQFIFLKRAL